MYPAPIRIAIKSIDRVPVTSFSKEFNVAGNMPEDASLIFRAWGDTRLALNDRPVELSQARVGNWKKEISIPIASYLKQGKNKISAEIRNPMGPGLLSVLLEGLPAGSIVSDETWQSEISGLAPTRAILADDTRMHPKYLSKTLPYEIFCRHWKRLAGYFAFSVLLFWLGRFMMDNERSLRWLPLLGLLGIQAAWFVLFFKKFLHFPVEVGFDFEGHLNYIRYVFTHHKLPAPDAGWELHQPPFFYMASAWARSWLGEFFGSGNEDKALKAIPFLSGSGQTWMAFFLSRRVFEKEPVKIFLAVIMAGIIPVNIYMSAYASNEALHAFFASAMILSAAGFLTGKNASWPWILSFGFLAGLALLTKFTAIAVIAVSFFFLAAVLICLKKVPFWKTAAYLGAAASLMLLISGWFYWHNFKTYGRWLVVDWHHFWQDPGFHTIRYFSIFGQSLNHPYFAAGFRSFWDGVYATFWGDGLGDRYGYSQPALWNYDNMSIGYFLALPATVLFGAGALRAAMAVFGSKASPELRGNMSFLLSIIVCGIYSIVYFCLMAPFWSSPKAGYALYLTLPLSVLFASGFEAAGRMVPGRLRFLWQAVMAGWFGALIAVLYFSYV